MSELVIKEERERERVFGMERKKRLVVVLVKEKREKPWFWKGKRD